MRWSYVFIVFLILVIICISIWAFAVKHRDVQVELDRFHNHHLVQFIPSGMGELERFRELVADVPLQFWSNQFVPGLPIVFQVKPDNVSWFATQMDLFELPFTLLTPNLQKVFDPTYQERNLKQLNNSLEQFKKDTDFDVDTYNPLENIVKYLEQLNATQRHLVNVKTFGKSYEQRPMYVVRISENAEGNFSTNCEEKPIVFFECGIHAREWLSPAVCLQFVHRLLNDVDYTVWLKHYDFYFVPVLNPDGYTYSWTGDRMWRKNRRKVGPNCYGVDLNRNFGVGFKNVSESMKDELLSLRNSRSKRDQLNVTVEEDEGLQHNSISHNQNNSTIKNIDTEREPGCYRLNPGITPFSEYETHSFNSLLTSMVTKPTLYFSMHTYSQLWIYPYGYTEKPSEYKNELEELTKLALDALQKQHGNQWKGGSTIEILYQASGISIDWLHQEMRVPYVFLVEMRDQGDQGGFGFLLPEDQIKPAAEEVWAGVTAMLEHLLKNRTTNENENC